ncbi:SAM-dependent methyltransferase [Saccharomonospora sp. NPDC006951]
MIQRAPSSVPVGVDPTRASIARVYDAALGGSDNYAIDRDVLATVARFAPEVNDLAVSNRRFLTRVVRAMASVGIRQFLDCGSGLPTADNTHQIAQRERSDAVVVYVDNDPVVIAHGEAMLLDNELTHIAAADIFRPGDVLGHPTVTARIDFSEPVGLLHSGIWHHYLGDDIPALMGRYIDALPSGSIVALSHFLDPETEELSRLARRMESAFVHSAMGSGRFRTRAEIAAMLPGLDIVKPSEHAEAGVELCDLWQREHPGELNQVQRCIAAIVGRKP